MARNLKELAAEYGHPYNTTRRHIRKLIEEKKYKPTSVGKLLNETDYLQLCALLGFKPKLTAKQ